ncbi:hypothetical protein [Sphingomonas sp. Leaf257]|jgi:hypothetical protein|uniref:hypothetical protein n=1 Tax=Sphingomonas sp. Leaf257 TaxID=1736309 RepID=UPI0006F92465|nr:hypothetical protein [Sphingomonas sp. Leaf257]KQO52952.1 hypothetical protein ASF14_06810 [Sphingomonas sp. Leaf257]
MTPRRRAVTRAALLFTLLTWARTNETRHARWEKFEDFDGPAPLWRVLAQRMKMALERDEVRGAITLRLIFSASAHARGLTQVYPEPPSLGGSGR